MYTPTFPFFFLSKRIAAQVCAAGEIERQPGQITIL